MKANRLCIAALLALAGGVHAQPGSSVTLFGTIDLGIGSFKSLGVGVNAMNPDNKQIVNGTMTTSLWGLRGSEDLGGGLNAIFELSSFFRANTGAAGRSDAVGPPVNVVTFIGSPLTGGTGWTNQIIYDTPRLGGLVVSAAISAAEGQGGRNHGLRAAYAGGPLAVSAAWQEVEKNPLTFADGTSPNNTRAWQLGGSYDFKAIKLFAHLGQIDNRGTEAAPADIVYKLWEVSATAPVGAGRVLAGYAQRKSSDTVGLVPATAAGGNIQRKVLSVGYDHDLSKRTDVYAVVMSDKTLTRTLPAPGSNLSASATNYAVGIRHRF